MAGIQCFAPERVVVCQFRLTCSKSNGSLLCGDRVPAKDLVVVVDLVLIVALLPEAVLTVA